MADQKLNIIFTGDVSQLNKAMQSAEAELTKFEAKLKDSLGVEAFASINQQVEQLKQKLASLKAIDIEANPEKLFTAVREVSAELGKLKDSEVLLKLNDSKALAQIQNIDKQLSSLSASITIDANVKTEIDRIKAQLAGLTVKIGADGSVAEAAIKNIQSKLALLQDEKFILSADGNQAESVINEIFTDLQKLKDTKVLINADGTSAENVIEQLHTNLQKSLQGNVTIDTAELQSKINQLSELELRLDTSEVDASIKSIREKLAVFQTIDIKANPQQALTAINEILTDISKIKSSELILKSDNTDVLADINQIQSRLQEVKSTIIITPTINSTGLDAGLLEAARKLNIQDVKINLDGTQVLLTIDQVEQSIFDLKQALKKATDPTEVGRLTASLVTLRNSISVGGADKFTSALSKVSPVANQAQFAVLNLGRVLQDSSFGFIGIANNLNPLLESFQRLSSASKLAGVSMRTQLLTALTGPAGIGVALSAVTAALQFASLGFSAWTRGFGGVKNSVEDAKESFPPFITVIDRLQGRINEFADSVGKDAAKISILSSAIEGGVLPLQLRAKAIEQVLSIYPDYLTTLEKEKLSYEAISKSIVDSIADLGRAAEVKALFPDFEALFQRGIKAQVELNRLRRLNAPVAPGVENIFAFDEEEFKQEEKKLLDIIRGAKNEIEVARKSLSTIAGGDINLVKILFGDSLTTTPKEIKDLTDAIIARARAFVKQFGEIFVVPDLDESFTNTKDIILKSAKQLLKDVADLNLKIKIPVQVITEADLIKDPEPLSKEKLDEIRQRFLDEIQNKFKEPFKIDITISPQVKIEKAKEEIRKAVQDGKFEDALNEIQFKKTDPQTGITFFEGLSDSAKTMAKTINETLTPAFQGFFDALIQGESPIKAFFDSIVQSVNQVIQKLIQAAIQAAILSAIGAGSVNPLGFGTIFKGLLGVGGQANLGRGFIGGIGGSVAGGTLTTRVSGTDLEFVLNAGRNIIGSTR